MNSNQELSEDSILRSVKEVYADDNKIARNEPQFNLEDAIKMTGASRNFIKRMQNESLLKTKKEGRIYKFSYNDLMDISIAKVLHDRRNSFNFHIVKVFFTMANAERTITPEQRLSAVMSMFPD